MTPRLRPPDHTAAELAAALAVGVRTIERWRYKGILTAGGRVYLTPVKVGGRVRYTRAEVDRFLAATGRARTGSDIAAEPADRQ